MGQQEVLNIAGDAMENDLQRQITRRQPGNREGRTMDLSALFTTLEAFVTDLLTSLFAALQSLFMQLAGLFSNLIPI